MIKANKIIITRAEGPIDSDFKPKMVMANGKDVWTRANAVLAVMARTAPKNGCYDKTNFEIHYTDGEIYKGRYDLKRHDVTLADIGRNMWLLISFHAGRRCPRWMGKQGYQAFLERDRETVKIYRHFLDHYEIGRFRRPGSLIKP